MAKMAVEGSGIPAAMKVTLNLLPEEIQKRQTEIMNTRCWLFFVAELILAAALLVTLLGLYVHVQRQKQQYEECWQPVLTRLQEHNKRMDSRAAAGRMVQQKMDSLIHWPALLVVIAETKPAGITVQRLSQEENRISLFVESKENGAVQQWQQRLQRSEWFSKAVLGKMQRRQQGIVETEIHLVIQNEDKKNVSEKK